MSKMGKEEEEAMKKKDLERFRVKQEFGDGNSKGSIIIDEVSEVTFLEFRTISRKYFGNKDSSAFSAILQLFLAEKSRQKVLQEKPGGA